MSWLVLSVRLPHYQLEFAFHSLSSDQVRSAKVQPEWWVRIEEVHREQSQSQPAGLRIPDQPQQRCDANMHPDNADPCL